MDLVSRSVLPFIQTLNASDPNVEDVLLELYSRLLAENFTHELIHALVGFIQSSPADYHYSTAETDDIMNRGGDRSFLQRTGFVVNTSSADISMFEDKGIGVMSRITAKTQKILDKYFPIPPEFK